MVKILGGSLVLIAAYLFGMKLMEPAAEHIRLLEAVSYTHLTLPTICSV